MDLFLCVFLCFHRVAVKSKTHWCGKRQAARGRIVSVITLSKHTDAASGEGVRVNDRDYVKLVHRWFSDKASPHVS